MSLKVNGLSRRRGPAATLCITIWVERRLNADVKVPLFQFEYDALVSIVYNCGSGDGASEIIRKVNSGHYDDMHDFILTYRVGTNRGVKNRRIAEARLFVSGVYDASH
ncbi:glycoside hydrolase family protein [Paraburkholderia sp. MM5482-R1]|uniref:glycoside hydrolase family protein n=1 Tax=unclassified Paraburkholderia TaxID=2615204 RepID=UPI003D1C51C5